MIPKLILVILGVFGATPAFPVADHRDECLAALSAFEFGSPPPAPSPKPRAVPVISIHFKNMGFEWNGLQIKKMYGTPTQSTSVAPLQFSENAPAPKAQIIWNQANGKVEPSFPSDQLNLLKERIIENSFFSLTHTLATQRNVRTVFNCYQACALIDGPVAPGSAETIGAHAHQQILLLKKKFPDLAVVGPKDATSPAGQ